LLVVENLLQLNNTALKVRVIIMDTINAYMKHLHNHILSLTSHPYVRRFLQDPIIDEDKLYFLILLLQDLELTDEERDQYISATMLVQIALDIHDHIPASTTINDKGALQEHQLTILAGDYYSGLYYYILSKLEHIDLIRLLAEGIKDINEKKIVLQQNILEDEEEIFTAVQIIQSSLIVKVAECFSKTNYQELIQQYLLLSSLRSESAKFRAEDNSFVFDALSRLFFQKEVKDLLETERRRLQLVVEERIHSLHSSCAQSLLSSFNINSGVYKILNTTLTENELLENSYAEEG